MGRVAQQCRERDLVCGGSSLLLWCVPTLALVLSSPLGDERWWIWSPALVVMGTACLVNAARCGRLHCYLTGPVFLLAAVFSTLRGWQRMSISWNWIGGFSLFAWLAGYVLELFTGPYAESTRRD